MQRCWIRAGGVLLGLFLFVATVNALITRPPSLAESFKENQFIFLAKVDKFFPEKPAVVFVVEENLKGKFPFRRMPVNLTGDAEAKKLNHTPVILKRLATELPTLFFASQRGSRLTVFGYTNGTWFQMVGQRGDDKETQPLAFTHCEPYLRRTFKGTTAELRQIIIDGLSGKKAPPPPDEKETPGFGPEVKPTEKGEQREEASAERGTPDATERIPLHAPRSTLFAVIPTLGIGGPLAILALLFPSVFGGVLVLFRQWLAFFSILGMNSTLYFLHLWFGDVWFRNSWWSNQTALWFVLTMVTAIGALWAWQRHYRAALDGQIVAPPARTEHLVLLMLSLSCLAIALFMVFDPPANPDTSVDLFKVFALGIWVATLYRLGFSIVNTMRTMPTLALPTEAIILGTVLLASTALAATRPAAPSGFDGTMDTGDPHATQGDRPIAKLLKDKTLTHWFDQNGVGTVFASPLVVGDRVYVACAHGALNRFGVLYCLDLKSQKEIWNFDNDGDMKQIYSTPCLVDGRIYIGEGFHEDKGCRLFCIDAVTGKKVWEPFHTTSHTESTPVVANGKVYFGAGDDGIYCIDAATGKQIWQFPDPQSRKELHFHCDASPAVVGNRVYVGGGMDEDTGEGDPAIVCLDADTGKKIWLVRTDLPSWAAPVVAGDQVFFALGNGRITESSKRAKPAGALLCVDPKTGKELWPRFKVNDGILKRPAVDDAQIYFGSRDGHCYCLNRIDGKLHWKTDLGSPVVASPALGLCGRCGHTASIFAIASEHGVSCLDPKTGKEQWSLQFSKKVPVHVTSSPQVVVQATPAGDRRLIYFGANLRNFTMPALFRLEDLLPGPGPKE